MRYGFRSYVDAADTSDELRYVADIAAAEVVAIRQVFGQVATLLDQASTQVDPAMRRLFPDGYRDDADAATELRRFSEGTLRSGKLEAVNQVLAVLAGDGQRQLRLSGGQAQVWLTALTDARLVLGVRLDIGADTDVLADRDSDRDSDTERGSGDFESKGFMLAVYQYLTFLQESLVDALTQRVGERDRS